MVDQLCKEKETKNYKEVKAKVLKENPQVRDSPTTFNEGRKRN